MIIKLPKKTYLQKERFIRYCGLQPNELKKETLSAISKEQRCTPSAVRNSVISTRIAMFHILDEEFSIFEKI